MTAGEKVLNNALHKQLLIAGTACSCTSLNMDGKRELHVANVMFSVMIENVDAIMYRYVKFDDPFVGTCRNAGFSLYAIAHGSYLFQRLLMRCQALYLRIATLSSFMVPPHVFNMWNEYVALRGDKPYRQDTSHIAFEEVLNTIVESRNSSIYEIPGLVLFTCCSLAAKFLDCSSSIVHNVTALVLGRLGCQAKYALLLESAILGMFDWNICPSYVSPEFAEVITSIMKPVHTIALGCTESSSDSRIDLLCKEVVCANTQ